MKKILRSLIAIGLVLSFSSKAFAASPKVTFELDCNTQEKLGKIGYQSDPDSPANGPEVIALKFTFQILSVSPSTFDDIKNVTLAANSSYTNFIVAENNKTQTGNAVEITFAGGFTGGTGVAQAADLIQVKGIDQKAYQIQVKSGELYPKNSTTNIYTGSNETFVANPNSCGASTQTPTPSTPNTNTNTNTPATTSNTTQATSIQLTANKSAPTLGEAVEVTAIIANRNNKSIDWSQTAGAQINPQISNEELPDGTTKSVLSFSMVDSSVDLVLKVAVGTESKQITVKATPAKGAANQTTTTPTTSGGTTTSTGTQETANSLQDRLQQRREELNEQSTPTTTQVVQPSNVHNAAGGLSQSGPAETGMMVLLAMAAALAWKKIRRSEVDVNV